MLASTPAREERDDVVVAERRPRLLERFVPEARGLSELRATRVPMT
jgi:hypothetical protein